jgi:hypothetical protein
MTSDNIYNFFEEHRMMNFKCEGKRTENLQEVDEYTATFYFLDRKYEFPLFTGSAQCSPIEVLLLGMSLNPAIEEKRVEEK